MVEAPAASAPSGSSSSSAGNVTGGSTSSDNAAGEVSGGAAGSATAVNASLGCYLFQNQLGAEITVTFTAQGRDWNNTFKLGVDAEREECFEPGAYTYTLDAPPPWGSTNGEMEVAAGDNFYFPISPE